jgi:uncharacterized membrane protein
MESGLDGGATLNIKAVLTSGSGFPKRLPSDGKEEIAAGNRIEEPEHQMAAIAVIGAVFVNSRMTLGVPMPLIPGSPVTLIAIAVSSMVVMLVASVLLVGVFAVSMITAVFVMSAMTIVADGVAMIISPVTAVVVSLLFVSMALLVILRMVPPPLVRSFFPVIGKGHTGEAKSYNGYNANDTGLFHWFPPKLPE